MAGPNLSHTSLATHGPAPTACNRLGIVSINPLFPKTLWRRWGYHARWGSVCRKPTTMFFLRRVKCLKVGGNTLLCGTVATPTGVPKLEKPTSSTQMPFGAPRDPIPRVGVFSSSASTHALGRQKLLTTPFTILGGGLP